MTQTIEQLTARVRELEEEKKELQALLDFDNASLDQIEDELEDVEYLGPYVEGIKVLKKQLAAVQEEMNGWRNKAHQLQSSFDRLEDQLAALKAENESLRKDAERLDWVEHQDFHDLSFAILVDQPNDGMTAVSISEGWHLGNNLREAIDAAMAQG